MVKELSKLKTEEGKPKKEGQILKAKTGEEISKLKTGEQISKPKTGGEQMSKYKTGGEQISKEQISKFETGGEQISKAKLERRYQNLKRDKVNLKLEESGNQNLYQDFFEILSTQKPFFKRKWNCI